MIITVYIILVLFTLALTKMRCKTYIRPNTIFTIIWGVSGILACTYSLGLITPHLKIHIYIIITILTFNIIYLIFTEKNPIKKLLTISRVANNKRIIAFSVIGLMLISPNAFAALKILLSSGFDFNEVRINYSIITGSGRFFYVFFTNNIPVAIFGAVSLIAAIDLVNKQRKLLFLALFNVLVATFTFGGRFLIFNFVIYYFAGYIILKKYGKIKIKKSYVFFAVISLLTITFLRGTSGMSLLDMGVLYYVGSFSYFQLIIDHPVLYGLSEPLLHGYLTFGFLLEPFVLILKFLFNFNIDVPSYHFNIYTQPFVNIGESKIVYFNNNATMLYTFIRDFGESGIVIGTTLIAVAVVLFERLFSKNGKKLYMYILVILYTLIVNSTMFYTLMSVSSSLLIIFVIVLSTNENSKINS